MDKFKLNRNGTQQPQPRLTPQVQQFAVDVSNATPVACECGCVYFMPFVKIFKVSALVSPTGKEITANQSVLLCLQCRREFGAAPTRDQDGGEKDPG